jgi:hypothetical protein
MQMQPWLAYALARDAQSRRIDAAARERSVARSATSPIRRAVGRRIVSIGARIAAEPSLELVRSR